jgi:hypothetical protein
MISIKAKKKEYCVFIVPEASFTSLKLFIRLQGLRPDQNTVTGQGIKR